MIINQCLALTQTILEILPFPRVCASAVAASQIATFVAPRILPIGKSSFSDPQKQAKVEKIKQLVEQVKHKLGLEKLNIEVRISDIMGSEITVLGSQYSIGSPLLIIGSNLIFGAKNEKAQAAQSFQNYQEALKSIKEEQDINNQGVSVAGHLHKMSADEKVKLLTLYNLYKDVLTDDELELKIAENINQIVSHTALKSLSYLGALWGFARCYTSFLRLLSIRGDEFIFVPDNYLESAINYIRKYTYISVPIRKFESVSRFFLIKGLINSTPDTVNNKAIQDNKIFPGRAIDLKKKWLSYIGNSDRRILNQAQNPQQQIRNLGMILAGFYGVPIMLLIIANQAWKQLFALTAVSSTLYALNYVRKTKVISKTTEYALITLSLIELTHFMFDNKFVEDQLLNLELKSFSFTKSAYQHIKPVIKSIERIVPAMLEFSFSR